MSQRSAKILYHCRLRELTLNQLADIVGINISTLRSYICGYCKPPSTVKELVADALGVPVEPLWNERKLILPAQRKHV